MVQAAPGILRRDARPPIEMDSAPPPGAAPLTDDLPYAVLRPTARPRPLVAPLVWNDAQTAPGYAVDHSYVRRYWTAVLGPGAVADLLRLATAAQRGRSLPRPVYLEVLAREDLVRIADGHIIVRPTVPPLAESQMKRLSPRLRRQHAALRLTQSHRP